MTCLRGLRNTLAGYRFIAWAGLVKLLWSLYVNVHVYVCASVCIWIYVRVCVDVAFAFVIHSERRFTRNGHGIRPRGLIRPFDSIGPIWGAPLAAQLNPVAL